MRRLGKYELVAKIGEGGMAEVHLARQRGPRKFEKLVVVKTVRPMFASRHEVASMLLEEARIAALVKHHNVVDIYDLGEENGTFFIAMEYLEGEALSAVLKASRPTARLDPFSTARIIADCAAGLHAAHELHSLAGEPLELVHQDVTPGNVIVLNGGSVKLVDFGVAKVRTSLDDGLLKGKTGYIAPELLEGAVADRRSDLWSLGVVLWEALTLKRLFHGKTEGEAVEKIRGGEILPPSSLVPSIPRDLDEVCFNALTRDPEKRYRTAAAMQADLVEILRHASWSGSSEPIARFMRTTFSERIAARKELLRELAASSRPRATTLERLQAIPDDKSPAAVPEPIIGSHGTGRISDQIVVIEMHEAASDAQGEAVAPAPTARMPPPGRRRTIAVIVGIAAMAIIAVAVAQTMTAPTKKVEGGSITRGDRVGGGDDEPDVQVEPDPEVKVVPTTDHDGADVISAADPIEPRETLPDKRRSREDRDRVSSHDRNHDRDRDRDRAPEPKPEPDPPSATPATAKSLYKEGLRTFVSGDIDGAIALFDKAKAKDSHYAPTYRGLGMAYVKRGDKKRAARAFSTYLDLAPNASDAAKIRQQLESLR
jgi:serine/threonine-protein kinase